VYMKIRETPLVHKLALLRGEIILAASGITVCMFLGICGNTKVDRVKLHETPR
jgi:hypothetical protein